MKGSRCRALHQARATPQNPNNWDLMNITMFVLLIEKKTLIDLIIMIFMSIVFHLKEEYRLYLITVEIVAFLTFLLNQ